MIISFYNKKGGVAKTTSAIVIGSILAKSYNKRVILIDLDMQGDLTTGMKLPNANPDNTIWNSVFRDKKILVDKLHKNFVVINGDKRMTDTSFMQNINNDPLLTTLNPNEILKKLLDKYRNQCDVILLDCPPSADIIVRNAMIASDYVLIPTKPHNFDINGVYNALELIKLMNQGANPNLKPLGVFFTQWDSRTNLHQVLKENLREEIGQLVMECHIRQNSRLQEMTTLAKDVTEFMKELREDKRAFLGYEDYAALTSELLKKIKI